MPVCFTSCHLCQLTSVCQFLLHSPFSPQSLTSTSTAALPSSLCLSQHTVRTQFGLSLILAIQVLFSVCRFLTTVMLVPLDHNIFCVSLYPMTIRTQISKDVSISKAVRIWNDLLDQLDAKIMIYWWTNNNMFRAPLCPSSEAQGCTLLHTVFST